jgi:hypothetical protein
MKKLMSKRWTMLLLVLILLLGSVACQAGIASSPVITQAPEIVASETAAPATVPESVSVEANVVFGSGPFNFPDTKAGLADLSSYKATLILSFDGTRAGQPSQWSKTYVMLSAKEPEALQLTIEKAGDLSDLDTVLMAEVDGAAYEARGENACNANVIEEGNSLIERLDPAGFLSFVIGAEEAGVGTVNEVAANHYTFDERAFGQLGLAKSTGEMWVASEGGYIIKYIVTTEGDADYFGEGVEGILTWDYELTDVNQPVTFTLPDDCPAGMVNVPLLPDASNVLNMPSILAYETASSLADIATFYQSEIPNLGWELTGEPTITDTTVLMDFTQGDQTMAIVVTMSKGTTVNVILGKSQE